MIRNGFGNEYFFLSFFLVQIYSFLRSKKTRKSTKNGNRRSLALWIKDLIRWYYTIGQAAWQSAHKQGYQIFLWLLSTKSSIKIQYEFLTFWLIWFYFHFTFNTPFSNYFQSLCQRILYTMMLEKDYKNKQQQKFIKKFFPV